MDGQELFLRPGEVHKLKVSGLEGEVQSWGKRSGRTGRPHLPAYARISGGNAASSRFKVGEGEILDGWPAFARLDDRG